MGIQLSNNVTLHQHKNPFCLEELRKVFFFNFFLCEFVPAIIQANGNYLMGKALGVLNDLSLGLCQWKFCVIKNLTVPQKRSLALLWILEENLLLSP